MIALRTFLMKISILTPDFSSNCLGRSYLLARLLQKYHQVKIVGPMFGEHIWLPLMNTNDITFIPIRMKPYNSSLYCNLWKIVRECNGDILYASKPLITSFGLGIIAKRKYNIPLILDIDDWEIAPFMMHTPIYRYLRCLRYINNPFSFIPTLLMNRLIKMADFVTVSSKALMKLYSGVIIPHVRKVTHVKIKTSKKQKTIMFLGTPRPHKGLDDLIEAFRQIEKQDIILRIVGINDSDRDCQKFISLVQLDKRIQLHGMVPFDKLNIYIAMADIIVIPQRNTLYGRTQLPAKLFDAMAQGKPIIATRVSDIPEILNDCGIIVEPGNVTELQKAIEYLVEHPQERKSLGKKAVKRCELYYNFETFSRKLNNLITSKFYV